MVFDKNICPLSIGEESNRLIPIPSFSLAKFLLTPITNVNMKVIQVSPGRISLIFTKDKSKANEKINMIDNPKITMDKTASFCLISCFNSFVSNNVNIDVILINQL